MDPPHSLHKSTISPSGSDLCPVRDTCNWGRAVAALLGGVCACIREYVSVCMHRAKCWQVCLQRKAVPLGDKSLVTSRLLPVLSSLIPLTPFHPSFLSGEVSLSIERVERCVCVMQNTKQEERTGGRTLRDSRCLS